ncbi:hypothetical protein GCM10010390_13180 [Streptomyces mordarskii]|uniref:HTH luxR-type domain-containing protein n=1 Tax=Streptomyces mordarskii TaxID=1226758 RepID=A0ABP3M570_9ACTN
MRPTSWTPWRNGLTNAEIRRHLVIAEATVKTHLPRLFAKLDVHDRTRAVVVAMERGLPQRPHRWSGVASEMRFR